MSDTHDHPIRGRFHAWFLSAIEDLVEQLHGDRKRAFFRDLPERVVEIGPGVGANFRHYPAGTEVVAVEPNVRLWDKLRAAAATHDLKLDLRGLRGELAETRETAIAKILSVMARCECPGDLLVFGWSNDVEQQQHPALQSWHIVHQ